MKNKVIRRIKRHKSIRPKVLGTAKEPRLVVFRSNTHIYGLLVDDTKGKTLASFSDLKLKTDSKNPATKTQKAYAVGKEIATLAKKLKITKATFDRAGFHYHGRVRALAEGAREGSLKL